MTRTGHSNLLPLDPKIERTIRRLQQERNMVAEDPNDINIGLDMATERQHEAIRAVHHPLNDYITPSVADAASSIRTACTSKQLRNKIDDDPNDSINCPIQWTHA